MGQNAQQYTAPFIYRALTVPGSGSAAKTFREMIVAVTDGAVPQKPISGFLMEPSATIRMYGGLDRDVGLGGTFVAAAAGGDYKTIPTSTGGIAFDISDPLDNIKWKMDGAGAGTMDLILFTEQ